MKIPFFLTVSSGGSVRVTKAHPGLNWDELSIYCNLSIPDQLFRKPQLQASITIPEEVVMKTPINAKVADNVAEAIEQSTGLKFAITIEGKQEVQDENINRN